MIDQHSDLVGKRSDDCRAVYSSDTCRILSYKIDKLVNDGWPAAFIFMFSDTWSLLEGPWNAASLVLGEDCLLEPTVFAWRSGGASGGASASGGAGGSGDNSAEITDKPPTNTTNQISTSSVIDTSQEAPSMKKKKPHENFGLPHRDYSYEESHYVNEEAFSDIENIKPCLLCCWLPITDASNFSGCLNMVPKEFDSCFYGKYGLNGDENRDHLRAATGSDGNGDGIISNLRFDISCTRCLPIRAGTPLLWRGNVIHWGGKCSTRAGVIPRMSIGCTFRAKRAQEVIDLVPTQHLTHLLSFNYEL